MNTEQKHTLLPCPFCGGKAKEYERFNSNTVTCLVCGVKVRQSEMGQGDASERWNRRAALQSHPASLDMEDIEYELRNMASTAYEVAMSFGVGWDSFERLANDVFSYARSVLQSKDREDAEEIAATLATALHFIPRREEPELYDDIDALCVQFSDHARRLREKGISVHEFNDN